MANPKKRKNRTRTLLREQERETVTEVITKKVIVVEEPVVVEEIEEIPLDFSTEEQPDATSAWEITMTADELSAARTKAARKSARKKNA